MSFEDHWEDYNFRNAAGLCPCGLYGDHRFTTEEVKRIAKLAYNAGIEDATPKPKCCCQWE